MLSNHCGVVCRLKCAREEREREKQLGGRDKRRERGRDEGKGCIQMIILSNHCGVVCRLKCARVYNDTVQNSSYTDWLVRREKQLGGRDKRREREGDEGKGCIQMIILSNHCGVVCRLKCARVYNDTVQNSSYTDWLVRREKQLGGRDKRREREGDEGKGCIQMIILSMHITTLHF